MPRRKYRNTETRNRSNSFLRRPIVQIFILLVVAVIIYFIALGGSGGNAAQLTAEISVEQAHEKYQQGAFFLDVREQTEWDEYHIPNTTLIPLGQLASRLNELPKDKPIIVVCRSGNRSQQGRDILLAAGFQATSMSGGLKEWYAKGYAIEGAPPQ